MKPSNGLTESQRHSAIEAAALALKKLAGSSKLQELRHEIVLMREESNYKATSPGIWGVLGFGGRSFDTRTLLLTPGGIVDHLEHTDGFKAGGDPPSVVIVQSYGTTRTLYRKIVAEEKFEEIAEYYDLDAADSEDWLRRIES